LNRVTFSLGSQSRKTSLESSQNWLDTFVCCTSDATIITWQFERKTGVLIYRRQLSCKTRINPKFYKAEYTGCLGARMTTTAFEVGIITQQFNLSFEHYSSKNFQYKWSVQSSTNLQNV
jgi:hypothetical protein